MNYRVWHSSESFADYIIENTSLKFKNCQKKRIFESDANNPARFHTMPDHIKRILYLDAPDIVVELDSEPIFSIEISTEAGTGHNVFQRFGRLAASVENNVPAFYIYPEAVIIHRNKGKSSKWDAINPLVFRALERIMGIYGIPALFYYYPTDYRLFIKNPLKAPNFRRKGLIMDKSNLFPACPDSSHSEMKSMFEALDEILALVERNGVVQSRSKLLGKNSIIERRLFMQEEFVSKGSLNLASPISATKTISTDLLLNHLSQYEGHDYKVGELLRSRKETVVYQVDAKFRGDPYPGALAAVDYLLCREGRSFEERRHNLVVVWGKIDVDNKIKNILITGKKGKISDFVSAVQASESKNLLGKNFDQLNYGEIPRYYMQVRYGSMFSKVKHIRMFSYFADAHIFPDGALWRDA